MSYRVRNSFITTAKIRYHAVGNWAIGSFINIMRKNIDKTGEKEQEDQSEHLVPQMEWRKLVQVHSLWSSTGVFGRHCLQTKELRATDKRTGKLTFVVAILCCLTHVNLKIANPCFRGFTLYLINREDQ